MFKSEGSCTFCNESFSQQTINRHLSSCSKRKEDLKKEENAKENILLISASAGSYWIYFEVNGNEKLKIIDSFLRKLWLECCGHLSMFEIHDQRYYSSMIDSAPGDKSMNVSLSTILYEGLVFFHEYDFGSTTHLRLKCIKKRQGADIKEINLIARNATLSFPCASCKKNSEYMCYTCGEEGKDLFFCENCSEEHGHEKNHQGEESFLNIVNSPRMGVCGYSG